MTEFDEVLTRLREKQRELTEMTAKLTESQAQVRTLRGCFGGAAARCGWSGPRAPDESEPAGRALSQVSALSDELRRKEVELHSVRTATASESEALSRNAAENTSKTMALAETTSKLQVRRLICAAHGEGDGPPRS